MHDLSIRKVPGVGRVNERLLESIGIKVGYGHTSFPIILYQIYRTVVTSTHIEQPSRFWINNSVCIICYRPTLGSLQITSNLTTERSERA